MIIMSLKINPHEILAYLNRIGFHCISTEQLRDFIQDLQKLIKYDQNRSKYSSSHESDQVSAISQPVCDAFLCERLGRPEKKHRDLKELKYDQNRSKYSSSYSYVSDQDSSTSQPVCDAFHRERLGRPKNKHLNHETDLKELLKDHQNRSKYSSSHSYVSDQDSSPSQPVSDTFHRERLGRPENKHLSNETDNSSCGYPRDTIEVYFETSARKKFPAGEKYDTLTNAKKCQKEKSDSSIETNHFLRERNNSARNEHYSTGERHDYTKERHDSARESQKSSRASDVTMKENYDSMKENLNLPRKKKYEVDRPKSCRRSQFIKPWELQTQGMTAQRRNDPVAMYHRYQSMWKQQKLPGDDNRSELRWNVREKMIGVAPQPQPINTRAKSVDRISRPKHENPKL